MRASLLKRVAMLGIVFVAGSSLALAQPDIFSYGGVSVPIPDDGYDGTMGSMACVSLDNTSGVVLGITDFTMDMEITHTWVGDLTVKIWSPAGTSTTAMATPGQDAVPDDGSTCCGSSSDLDGTAINFANGNTFDAENMGIAGDPVCTGGGGDCDYFPNPNGAPGTDFSDFGGESAVGMWTICVGDGAVGDTGDILDFTLTVNGSTVANEGPADGVPGTHALSELYPNPFNPQSSFTLAVAETQDVLISVVNLLGQHVATLYDGVLTANQERTFTFEAGRLPSGVYLIRVEGESFTDTRRVTLLK